MNVAQSIVTMLEELGVEALFTGSGQGCADLLLALAESKKIRTVMTRHEQAAAFMAYGYAAAGGPLGVCNAQGGPGSSNLFSGVGMAATGGVPLLSISSYAPAQFRGKGDLGEMTGLFGTPDSNAMFGATAKGVFLLDTPEEVCDRFEEAVNLALSIPCGPVHMNLPYDVAGMENPAHRSIHVRREAAPPDGKEVAACAKILAHTLTEGKKLLLLLGGGCVRSGAGEAIRLLAERYGIPFVYTMDAKGLLADSHPLCKGMSGACGDPSAKEAIREAETVVAIGNSFAKWQTWQFEPKLFQGKTLITINVNPQTVNRVYPVDCSLTANAKPAVEALGKALAGVLPPDFPARRDEWASPGKNRYCFADIAYSGSRIHPGALAREIGRLLPDNALLLGDAGAHMVWLADYARLKQGQSYKNPGSFGPMASHTNGAIGYQLGNPDRRVIVGCGDGCYQMSGFELMTAVQEKIPVIWIIFNNSEFNIIKTFNLKLHGKEVFNHILGPDFAEYARLCGANGWRVARMEEFAPAFQAALASSLPSIIDVLVDGDCVMPFSDFV